MKQTFVDLIRHGQSLGNVRGVFSGHTDLDLTPLGYRQAELCAAYLEDRHYDAVFSSDLCRAYHTAIPTARFHGLAVQKTEKLREIDGGEWEEKEFDSLPSLYPEAFKTWKEDFSAARPFGGESVRELSDRIASCLVALCRAHEGGRIAVFTHATPVRVFRAWCEGKTDERMTQVPWPGNASVTTAVYENGAFTILSYGDNSFLGEMKTTFVQNI